MLKKRFLAWFLMGAIAFFYVCPTSAIATTIFA